MRGKGGEKREATSLREERLTSTFGRRRLLFLLRRKKNEALVRGREEEERAWRERGGREKM